MKTTVIVCRAYGAQYRVLLTMLWSSFDIQAATVTIAEMICKVDSWPIRTNSSKFRLTKQAV